MHWFAEHATKSIKYQFTKFGRLSARDPMEGAKNYFEVLLSISKRSYQKKTSNAMKRRKRVKCLICDFGCTALAEYALNLFNINLPNFVGSLQQTLRKDEKLF